MDKNQQLLNKWENWIEIIHKDIETILVDREIYKQYLQIVKRNIKIQTPSDFHNWIRKNYASSIVVGIRRQLENDRKVISLIRLLTEIEAHNSLLTRSWYKKKHHYDWADVDFTNVAGKGDSFDKNIAHDDIKKLHDLGKNIEDYSHEYIAHKAAEPKGITPTYKEVDQFISALEVILKKYILLFTASGYTSILPTWQYDWTTIFNQKWIK